MLYLIGGAPRLGKSIIAKKLMEKTGIPWLSTDVLRSVFFELAPEAVREKLYPYKGVSDNDEVYSAPIKTVINQQLTEAESMKIGLLRFMKHQIEVQDDFILEGVHILPEHVQEFGRNFPELVKHLKEIYIVSDDAELVLKGLESNTSHFDWLRGARPQTYRKVAEFIAEFSKVLINNAEPQNLFQRTADFNSDVKKIISVLC